MTSAAHDALKKSAAVMINLTEQCGNRTEPRATGHLDAAGCLFVSILPYEQAVPALIWVLVLLTLLSFLLNGMTLFGLGWSDDISWQPRFIFLKNLVLSDVLQTVTFSPAVIHSLVQRQTMAFSAWCHVQYFVGTAGIFSSLLTITCMALERYLYVCHAIHYLVILTRVRLRLALGVIWLYSIVISTINVVLLHTGGEQDHEPVTRGLLCEPDMVEEHMGFPRASAIFRKCMGAFTLLVCLLVYAFSYLRMYQDARKAMIPFNAINVTARRTVLFYSGMLLLQLLPLLLKVGSDALWEVEGTVAMTDLNPRGARRSKPPSSIMAAVLHMSLLVMLLVPPCINPLVYGLRSVEIRRALLRPLRWLAGRRCVCAGRVERMRGRNVVRRNQAQAG